MKKVSMGVTPKTRMNGDFLVENKISDNGLVMFAENLA